MSFKGTIHPLHVFTSLVLLHNGVLPSRWTNSESSGVNTMMCYVIRFCVENYNPFPKGGWPNPYLTAHCWSQEMHEGAEAFLVTPAHYYYERGAKKSLTSTTQQGWWDSCQSASRLSKDKQMNSAFLFSPSPCEIGSLFQAAAPPRCSDHPHQASYCPFATPLSTQQRGEANVTRACCISFCSSQA